MLIVKPSIETYCIHSVEYVNLHIVIPCYIFRSVTEKTSLHFSKLLQFCMNFDLHPFYKHIKDARVSFLMFRSFSFFHSFYFRNFIIFFFPNIHLFEKIKKVVAIKQFVKTKVKQFVAILVLIPQRFGFFLLETGRKNTNYMAQKYVCRGRIIYIVF